MAISRQVDLPGWVWQRDNPSAVNFQLATLGLGYLREEHLLEVLPVAGRIFPGEAAARQENHCFFRGGSGRQWHRVAHLFGALDCIVNPYNIGIPSSLPKLKTERAARRCIVSLITVDQPMSIEESRHIRNICVMADQENNLFV